MKEGKDIDKLFKDGLENPDLPFNDLDWDNLEERLHPAPKRRVVPLIWLTAVAGIAAMLLVVFLLVKPNDNLPKNNSLVKTDTNTNKKENNKALDNTSDLIETPTANNASTANNEGRLLTGNKESIKAVNEHNVTNGGTANTHFPKVLDTGYVISHNLLAKVLSTAQLSTESKPVAFEKQTLVATVAHKKSEKMQPQVFKKRPRLVLSIQAAPDLTSVQKSGKSSLSGGFGVEATLFLTKKLSVTTGAAYAKKIYDSDFSQYKPNSNYVFKVSPANIHANCDVIDIPINVNYKVFDGRRNSISVSTGLSSYLMLKEKYNYSYNGAYQGPLSYEVRNENQHYLGIANVGVEFQHKINNNLSISAKPFMKIPLTDIGYGNSKLSSTGVAVSVNMNLFRKGN